MRIRILKSTSLTFIALLLCLSSCSKEETITDCSLQHCMKSSYNLDSLESGNYPFVLDASAYPFQYSIYSTDIDDFLGEVHYYLVHNTQNNQIIISLDDNLELYYYGIIGEDFSMEQCLIPLVLPYENGNTVYGTYVPVSSNYSQSYSEIQAWAHAQMENGYTVIIRYDRRRGEYTAISYELVE